MNNLVDQQDNWSALPPETVLQRLGSSVTGLSDDEAARRLVQYGLNRLPSAKQRSALLRLLLQFHNVLLYVLLAASAYPKCHRRESKNDTVSHLPNESMR
jgi:magnesium-transporting ATPase (P-type)